MMSQRSKRELIEAIRPRYLKGNKTDKAHTLDEFVASTGYHRKYAIRLLHREPNPKRLGREGRKKIYQGEVVKVLVQLWELRSCICSKRLKPFLQEIVTVLEQHNELHISAPIKNLLLGMSRSTIDRCLQSSRLEHKPAMCTTKPGTLLKKAIPIRTWAEWDDARPGFVEMDLVAHCGVSLEGQFIYILSMVDVSTGWLECLAVPNRSQ